MFIESTQCQKSSSHVKILIKGTFWWHGARQKGMALSKRAWRPRKRAWRRAMLFCFRFNTIHNAWQKVLENLNVRAGRSATGRAVQGPSWPWPQDELPTATGRVVRYVRAKLSATGPAVQGPSCPLPQAGLSVVMVHNPAHDLFSIGHFLCRVRVVDCCDLRNGAERQWFIVATILGNFLLLRSLLAGATTVMHRYGPNDTYPCVFNMEGTTYPYVLADFYDAPQFQMINFANVNMVNIEHCNSDPVISLFGNIKIMFQYMEYDVTCIN